MALTRIKLRRLEANLVWVFGAPRTGSTWLTAMLAGDPRAVWLNEPSVGLHLGVLLANEVNLTPGDVPVDRMRINDVRRELPTYFFSKRYESTWLPLLRRLLLGRILAEVDDLAPGRVTRTPVLIKEPAGSQGADVLMAATRRSSMVFLQRDGRDVLDSELDAMAKGGWIAELIPEFQPADVDRMGFLKARAHAWLARTRATQLAYERHPAGRRITVRYEDLLADTPAELGRVASALNLELDAPTVAEKLAFSEIPTTQRGKGQFARAASPGLWRKNLSSAEQQLIERVMGATLREMGYS